MNPWLIVGLSLLAALLILACIYVILIKPCGRRGVLDKFRGVKYAHRGLHSDTAPENSLSAFRLAVEAGYGIELDVHTVKGGEVVVFHDGTLDRMVGRSARLCDFTAEELGQMKLLGSDEKIPTLREVLELVGGRVPLIVELKHDSGVGGVGKAAAELLRDYRGDFVVESFDPFTVAEFAKEMPEIGRGILAQRYTNNPKFHGFKYFLAENLLINRICKPDFVAYRHSDANVFSFRAVKALFKPVTVAWTVRSPEEEKAAYDNGFDLVIFENYIPEK